MTANPKTYVVNFGQTKSGLSSVGYMVKNNNRTTAGVTELVAHSGIYGVTLDNITTPSFILWDTGDSSLEYSVEDINIPLSDILFKTVNLGQSQAGLSNVGVLVWQTRFVATELAPVSGIYGVTVTPPRGFQGPIFWDNGNTANPVYVVDTINSQYELISFYETASYLMLKVNSQVGMIQTQNAAPLAGGGGTLLIDSGGHLLLSAGGAVLLSPLPKK
jgi:hypothetical protein